MVAFMISPLSDAYGGLGVCATHFNQDGAPELLKIDDKIGVGRSKASEK